MTNRSGDDRSTDPLTSIIQDIRKRWRLKLALRGAAFVVGGRRFWPSLVSAYALEHLKFSPGSIIAFRIGDGHDLRRAGAATSSCCRSGAASATSRSRSISKSASRRSKPPS